MADAFLMCRKIKENDSTSSCKKAQKRSNKMYAPSTFLVTQSLVSLGLTTRRMRASTSPLSPGPTIRSRAAVDISPGGIARRLIVG